MVSAQLFLYPSMRCNHSTMPFGILRMASLLWVLEYAAGRICMRRRLCGCGGPELVVECRLLDT